MPRSKPLLVNPVLCQFVYNALLNTTPHDRLNLNGKYLRAARHSKTAIKFAQISTDEEKAILLGKLGIPFAWAIGIDREGLKKLMDENIFGQQDIVDRAIKGRFIAIADKQFMQYIGLVASNCHSEMWMMNSEFLKVGYRMKEWRKQYYNKTVAEMRDGRQASKEFAKSQSDTMMMSGLAPEICGINQSALEVLLFMFSKDREFISIIDLKKNFNGIYRNFKVVGAITLLREAKFIEKSYLSKEIEYKVTALGADAVMRFQKRVLNAENF